MKPQFVQSRTSNNIIQCGYSASRVFSLVKMATACERLDDLVKDYLLFRGFTATTKALDHEIKHDKDKGLRV